MQNTNHSLQEFCSWVPETTEKVWEMEPHLSRCSTPNSFGYIIFITSSPSADPVSTAFTAHPGSWNPLPSLQIPKSELLHPTPPAWNPSTGNWVLSDCHIKFHSCFLSIGVKIKSPNMAQGASSKWYPSIPRALWPHHPHSILSAPALHLHCYSSTGL